MSGWIIYKSFEVFINNIRQINTMHSSIAFPRRSAFDCCKFFLLFFSGAALLQIFSFAKVMAQGDLMIFPKRAVFEGSRRSMELNLANNGKDTARYLVSIVQIRMKEDGGFENITKPDSGQQFADKYIRFFPRNVVLAPNEAQTVKVQLTRTNELSPGEYRSHIYFRAEPDKKPLGEENSLKDSTSISVKLIPVYGISIPVIIRVGESTANVNFSGISFVMVNDTLPTLKMTFNRSGNMSVYGDISVEYISPEGKVTRVGEVQGVAVYTPNLLRRAKINLKNLPGVDYHAGKLHLVYSAQTEDKGGVLAEAELPLH
jgi:hypothetical protein